MSVTRIGVIRNRTSTANSAGLRAEVPEGIDVFETESPERLESVLRAMRDVGTELIVVDGGDGTVRELATRLWRVFDTTPLVAVLAHGNTNLIARKAGSVRGADALRRLVAAAGEGRLARHDLPVLQIDFADSARPSLSGFMMGWGAYETGTRIAGEEMKTRGGRQVVQAVVSTIRRALWGREAAEIRRGIALDIAIDGEPQPAANRLVGAATTLPGSLVAGLNPFWGGGEGAIRWTDVTAPGRWLPLALPFALTGRPLGWMKRSGYTSGRAQEIDLAFRGAFVLDGERFTTGESGHIRLSAAQTVTFVSPM